MSLLDAVIPPWVRWAALAAAIALAFGAGWTTQGWRRDSLALDAQVEQTNALHEGWAKATQRWQARAQRNANIDQENERRIAALRAQVRALNEEIDRAVLIEPDQATAACPDPRRGEWLRQYNRAADPAAGPQDPAAVGVHQAARVVTDGT